MDATMGVLSGVAVVHGPDGQVKAQLKLTAECSQQQAEALALALTARQNNEEDNDGNNTR